APRRAQGRRPRRRGRTAVRGPDPRSRHARGAPRRASHLADPHGVRPAGAVHAASQARPRARVHPRGGVGLRLPHHRQLARGLRRLRPSQARGGGRVTPAAHRPRRRLRPAGDPAVTLVDKAHGFAHTVFEPITKRLSLAGRVSLLTTAAVAAVLTLISVSVFVLVRQEIVGALDDSMFKRANEAVAAGYTPTNLTAKEADLLSLAGIRLLAIQSGGGEVFDFTRPNDTFPYDNREREVA